MASFQDAQTGGANKQILRLRRDATEVGIDVSEPASQEELVVKSVDFLRSTLPKFDARAGRRRGVPHLEQAYRFVDDLTRWAYSEGCRRALERRESIESVGRYVWRPSGCRPERCFVGDREVAIPSGDLRLAVLSGALRAVGKGRNPALAIVDEIERTHHDPRRRAMSSRKHEEPRWEDVDLISGSLGPEDHVLRDEEILKAKRQFGIIALPYPRLLQLHQDPAALDEFCAGEFAVSARLLGLPPTAFKEQNKKIRKNKAVRAALGVE